MEKTQLLGGRREKRRKTPPKMGKSVDASQMKKRWQCQANTQTQANNTRQRAESQFAFDTSGFLHTYTLFTTRKN